MCIPQDISNSCIAENRPVFNYTAFNIKHELHIYLSNLYSEFKVHVVWLVICNVVPVNEGTESQPVPPAGCEVGHLKQNKKDGEKSLNSKC